MAKTARDHEIAPEQDTTARVAAVLAALVRSGVIRDEITRAADTIAALVRSGALGWSSLHAMPVTGKPDQLSSEIERWLRDG